MSWTLDNPSWLWLVALGVPLTLAALRLFHSMSRIRRLSAIVLRLALLGVLALLLAGLARVRSSDSLAVVFVVDQSESVTRLGEAWSQTSVRDRVAALLQAADRQRGEDDRAGLVVFAGEAGVLAMPTRGAVAPRWMDAPVASGGTNIARALELASSLIPPDAAGRIVLVSDGNATTGDALAAARALGSVSRRGVGGRRGVPVDVAPIDYRVEREVLVESVDAPPRASENATINLRVVLRSSAAGVGRLTITDADRPVRIAPGVTTPEDAAAGRLPVEFQAGRTVVLVPVELQGGRVHRFRATLEVGASAGEGPADGVAANNVGEAFTITPGKGVVLLVDGVGAGNPTGPGATLANTLERAGFEARLIATSDLPTDIVAFQAFDVVILQNVPAELVPESTQNLLASFVRDLGGGLIKLGGPDAFVSGGWRGSVLEPLLPVSLDLPERLVSPEAAVVFVLDNSGSMARFVMGSTRTQQKIANHAAAAAVSMLEPTDLIGVITFNDSFEELIPLGPNKNPAQTAQEIRGISSGGGTHVGPAFARAVKLLENAEAKNKHVIVLTDGKSMGSESLPGQAQRAAASGIKVSTIGVGDDADDQTLRRMAAVGNGTFYSVSNPSMLPRVFLKAVRIVRSPMVREGEFQPEPGPGVSSLVAPVGPPPPLLGLSITRTREDPRVVNDLLSPEGEPVLAHWNVELGQVAAFTSDAHAWASTWIDEPYYERFWSQLVRSLSRLQGTSALDAQVTHEGGAIRVRVDARESDGSPRDGLSLSARVFKPSSEAGADAPTLALSQVAPGVYEGLMPASQAGDASGTFVALVRPEGERSPSLRPVIAGTSIGAGVEFRALSSDRAVLERLAAASGGRVLELPGADLASSAVPDLFRRDGASPQLTLRSMWEPLLVMAIVLLLLDIATRRIAWDRWVTPEELVVVYRERASLRPALERSRDGPARRAEPSATLGEADAAALIAAARDRRRAERLASLRAATGPEADQSASNQGPARAAIKSPQRPASQEPIARPVGPSAAAGTSQASPSATESDPSASPNSLLAAKRRAARRFEDDES
ncbi:MAG: VWA domain-containing protein [Planctomycetota bacterium]|nr:VWA domain-containing protein [Planctomycetota bacterium]